MGCVETDPRVRKRAKQWRKWGAGIKKLLKEENAREERKRQEKGDSKKTKPKRSTRSSIIARHISQRKAGVFKDPRIELRIIDDLLDSDYLSAEERRWANRRRKVLLRRVESPTAREQVMGLVPPGRVSEEDEQRFGVTIDMKKCVNDIKEILENP